MSKTKKSETILKNFPELRRLKLTSNRILVQLQIRESSNLVLPGKEKVGGGMPTRRGWILAVGEGCTEVAANDVGKFCKLDNTVDLDPYINVSHTNVENLRPNPNFALFTFKDESDTEALKALADTPTILIYEHQIAGVWHD